MGMGKENTVIVVLHRSETLMDLYQYQPPLPFLFPLFHNTQFGCFGLDDSHGVFHGITVGNI